MLLSDRPSTSIARGSGPKGGMEERTCVGVEGEEGVDRAASKGRGDEIGYIYL